MSEVSWGYNFISKAVTASVVADSIAIYILLASFPTSCDASFHLKAWLLGCLCLSWPATAASAGATGLLAYLAHGWKHMVLGVGGLYG